MLKSPHWFQNRFFRYALLAIVGVSIVYAFLPHHRMKGEASWYGEDFRGKVTASGEIFNPDKLTAAHQTLPLGTLVEVTHLDNGRSIVVKINDRGPHVKNRIIDLSKKAAERIGMLRQGIAQVKIRKLN